MSTQTTTSAGGNGKEKGLYNFVDLTGEETSLKTSRNILRDTGADKEGEFVKYYRGATVTGEHFSVSTAQIDNIKTIIASSIVIIEDVIDVFDIDQVECKNKFTMFEERIKSIWKNREYVNDYFKEIIVHLLAAAKSSRYQQFSKSQYEAIKSVLKIIQNVNINRFQVKASLAVLIENKIDLFSPIRNWGDYIIEIRKRD